ncbi:hypothetical protein [Massilia sp. CT11-137]|uniref:hypothetical protein n=1 Tax=Massilia sp. CT11-137 TaxID=3393901 RepID=UPI0039A45AD5
MTSSVLGRQVEAEDEFKNTVNKTQNSKSKPSSTYGPDEDLLAALSAIYALAQDAGYELTKETVKLAEFVAPAGIVLYVEKTRANLNNINLCVHPKHSRESLSRMDGAHAVSGGHRFHSNMTRFPKRLHGGKTPTAYGWQVKVDTLLGLHRFLTAFADLSA